MPKSKTLSQREIRRQYLAEHKQNPQLPLFSVRQDAPRTRGECDQMQRPCPFVGCKYHLFIHECTYGAVKMPYGEDVLALRDMPDTCALDVADDGPQSQWRVSRLLNLTQQAVVKLEQKALEKVRRYIAETDNDDL